MNQIIDFEGKEYILKQDPYLCGSIENPRYEALAKDLDEKEYMVRWEIIRPEAELEEDRCDWHYPESVETL